MHVYAPVPRLFHPPLSGYRTNPTSPAVLARLGNLGVLAGPQNGGGPRAVQPLTAAQIAVNAQAAAYQAVLPKLIQQLRVYLLAANYPAAWAYAAANGDPTKPQGRGTNAYGLYGFAKNFNPLIALLETSAGINLLRVPPFTQDQMTAFYATARNYWDGNILGVNPYPGTEWGDPSYMPGDAIINFQSAPDNVYPNLARFSGRHPDPSFFTRWGAIIIAVVAAVVTYGASLALTAMAAADAAAAAAAGVAAGADISAAALDAIVVDTSLADTIASGVTFGSDISTVIDTATTLTDAAAAAGNLDAITVFGTSLVETTPTWFAPLVTAGTVGVGAGAVAAVVQPSVTPPQTDPGLPDPNAPLVDPTTLATTVAQSSANIAPTLDFSSLATVGAGASAGAAGAGAGGGSGFTLPTLTQVGQGLGIATTLARALEPGGAFNPIDPRTMQPYPPGTINPATGLPYGYTPPGTIFGMSTNMFLILAALGLGVFLMTGRD
jgi:hypothetical protein